MPKQQKNGERITVRVTPALKKRIQEGTKVGGYMNESDFIRQAVEQKLLFLGVVEGERHCSNCGKLLTREDVLQSQGWHCKDCFEKLILGKVELNEK